MPRFWVLFTIGCFLALAALVWWVIYISGDALTRRKIARLGKREPISATEFYNQFYADSGVPEALAVQIRNQVAVASRIPAELIRPTDRLMVELAPVSPWEPDEFTGPMQLNLFKTETNASVVLDYGRIRTVDDYIRAVAVLQRRGEVPEEWKFPHPLSGKRLVLLLLTSNLLMVGGYLGLSAILEHFGLTSWEWLLLLGLVLTWFAKDRWLSRYKRQFDFGKPALKH